MINKIVFDCEKMRHPNTGFFQFCKSLGNALIQQSNKNKEAIYIYVPPKQLHQFGNYPNILLHHSLQKFHHLKASSFHLWHCTAQSSNYFPTSRKLKKVLTIHDLNYLYEPTDTSRVKRIIKRMQKNIDNADHIVAISDYVKKDIIAHLQTDDKKISTIYNGLNIHSFNFSPAPAYQPAISFLFTIGAVMPKKNFHVLPALLTKNNLELVIAGPVVDEDYKQKILQQATKHNVSHKVKIIGSVSEKDKQWYYKNCLAFVFPSLAEGFGLPVIEAMHFGKPVFLSNLTALPEVGGKEAFYFENFSADYMQNIFLKGMSEYNSGDKKNRIKQHAQKFNWQHAADEYLKIYSELLEK